ncbi:MAG: tetratricopeptide repeat protein [Planctomycetota bacterium]|nr:tetratricopeptide repeat protein [Planctomycetota bacterium]
MRPIALLRGPEFRQAPAGAPPSPWTVGLLSGLLVAACGEGARDRTTDAAEAAQLFERGRASLDESMVEFGALSFDHEELGRAVASLERAIGLDPGVPEFHTHLGLAHERMGDMESAERAFTVALELDPDDLQALVHRSIARRTAGRFEEAGRDLERAVRSDPTAFGALHNLGLLRLAAKEWEAAYSAFERATRVAPARAEPWSGLQTALRRLGRDDEADRALERYRLCRAREARGGAVDSEALAHFQRGLKLMEEKRLDEAQEAFEKALALKPKAVVPRANIGLIHIWRGELGEARVVLEEALGLDPTNDQARRLLADLADQAKQSRRAGD